MDIKFDLEAKIKNNHGQSLLEVVVALAIFSVIAASLTTLMVGSFTALQQGAEQTEAEALAQEAIEAVRSIRDRAWNEGTYTTSAVEVFGNKWIYTGEGTTEIIGQYTRTISFSDVCRDASDEITACPGVYTDIHTKQVTVDVTWPVRAGIADNVQKVAYITNWDSLDWVQTDWSAGPGQTLWSNPSQYDSDDGNIDYSTPGQVSLVSLGGGCGKTWPFSIPGNYTYDSAKIEVTGGFGQLVGTYVPPVISGINNTTVDTFEYDPINGKDSEIINIANDVYAVVYAGPGGNSGQIQTITIDVNGVIGPVIDSFEYNPGVSKTPDIINVAGDIYAIAFEGAGKDGWLATVSIDSNGNIGPSVIDTLEFDVQKGQTPSIVPVSGDVFAIAYQGLDDNGWVVTTTIDVNGTISNSVLDSYNYSPIGFTPHILSIAGDIFAIVLEGPGQNGWVATLEIDTSGNITKSLVDYYEFDPINGKFPRIKNISGNIYAIVYTGQGDGGWVATITIEPTGVITKSIIDSLAFDPIFGEEPDIVLVLDDTYAVTYTGQNKIGYVTIFNIYTNGTIDNTVIDSLAFDTTRGIAPRIIGVGGYFYAITYSGPGKDGWLVTIEMETTGGYTGYPTDRPSINPTSSFTPSIVTAWTDFTETANKNGGEIYYQLSDNNGTTWQYWNGSSWTIAGATQYNTAVVVNANISSFPTGAGQISFKAFLESDGLQFVQLDEVVISCSSFPDNDWTFTTPANYSYDPLKIEVVGDMAQLVGSGSPPAVTGIANTLVDQFEFDAITGLEESVINIAGSVYAIAYRGPGSDGWIATVDINSSGIIGGVIDTFEFDTTSARDPDIIRISGDVYAIAYRGPARDGWLTTITIDSSGAIGPMIDTFEYNTRNGETPSIVQVAGSVYAIAYDGRKSDGWITTITINANGSIGGIIDTFEFDPVQGMTPHIINISGNFFAVAYTGPGNDGWLATVEISPGGSITNAVVDSYEFNTANGANPYIEHISGDIFAIAHEGFGDDGWIGTINITTTGIITKSPIDSLEFDTASGLTPHITHVMDDTYAVVYTGVGNGGFAVIFNITPVGMIDNVVIDSLEFDAGQGLTPFIIGVGGDYYAIAYGGVGNDGWLATIQMEVTGGITYPTDRPSISPTTSFVPSAITAWAGFSEIANKNGGEIYYQLSDDDGTTWQYWNGVSWVTAGALQYNIADDVNTNIPLFPITTGQIMFQAFLESDGTQFVQLDNVRISLDDGSGGGGGGGGSGFAPSGFLVSSAFDMGDGSPIQLIGWDQVIPACTPACEVRLQLRSAPDGGGVPGIWTSWYGQTGPGTYFTNPSDTLVSTILNGNQWVQYRVELIGDSSDTPILEEMRVNYK